MLKSLPLLLLLAPLAQAAPFGGWPDAQGELAPYHKAAPAFVPGKAWGLKGGAAVSVSIDAGKVIAPITPYHLGNNLSWWMGKAWALDQDRLDKATQAGIRFWRFPGGSASDEYAWDGLYGKYPKSDNGEARGHMNLPRNANTDDFIKVCRLTQADPILIANYGMARYGSLDDALQLAKSWLLYTNIENKFKVRHWEIGNEVYGNWEVGHVVKGKPELTGKDYGRDFRAYADALKSVDPSVYVGAVAINEDNGEEWTGYKWWMRDMLPEAADKADYLIWHNYFAWPFESDGKTPKKISNAEIFKNSAQIGEGVDKINAMVAKYSKRQAPLPIALTEYNILNGNMPQTLQLINALFTAEVVGEAIKHGIVAANYWDWKNGYDPANGGGDHAMLSVGEPGVPDSTPRPTYYSFALMSRALGERMVQAESGDAQVKVYASVFLGNELGLVVVNEKEEAVSLELSLGAFGGSGKASLYTVTGEGLNGKAVLYNGQAGPGHVGGPFPIDPIAPYAISYPPKKPLKISLPATSLSGLILH